MKNSIILLLVLISQIVSAQLKNPLNPIKGNPSGYEERTYFMKSKDVIDLEKKVYGVTLQKKYYPDDFENYSLKTFDSIAEQKDNQNQVIKRQKYFIHAPNDVSLSDEYHYEYNEKHQLVKTKHFMGFDLKDANPKPSTTYEYEYNSNGNIKRILKYGLDSTTVETTTEYTYKNGLPIIKTLNYYASLDKDSTKPRQQDFEFYTYDSKNRLIQKIKQFKTNVVKLKIDYNNNGTIKKIEEYATKMNSAKNPPYYTYTNNNYFNDDDSRNKLTLKSTEYYKEFDHYGNVTEILVESKKYNDENVLLYLLEKRVYNYKNE